MIEYIELVDTNINEAFGIIFLVNGKKWYYSNIPTEEKVIIKLLKDFANFKFIGYKYSSPQIRGLIRYLIIKSEI